MKRKNIIELRMELMSSNQNADSKFTGTPLLKKNYREKGRFQKSSQADTLASHCEIIKNCPKAFQNLYKISVEENNEEDNIIVLDPDFEPKILKTTNDASNCSKSIRKCPVNQISTSKHQRSEIKSSKQVDKKRMMSTSSPTMHTLKEPPLKKLKINEETGFDCSNEKIFKIEETDNVNLESEICFAVSQKPDIDQSQHKESIKNPLHSEISRSPIKTTSTTVQPSPLTNELLESDKGITSATRKSLRVRRLSRAMMESYQHSNQSRNSPRSSSKQRSRQKSTCHESLVDKENINTVLTARSTSTGNSEQKADVRQKESRLVRLDLKKKDMNAPIIFTRINKEKQLEFAKIINDLQNLTFGREIPDGFCVSIISVPFVKTLKFLLSVLNPQCHILSENWLTDSKKAGHWLSFENYYIDGIPKNGTEQRKKICHLFSELESIYISTNNINPGKMEIKRLIEKGGGKVTSSYRQAGIIINAYRPNTHCVTPIWLLDSIVTGEVQPLENYPYKKKV